jgi:hypothetical protein
MKEDANHNIQCISYKNKIFSFILFTFLKHGHFSVTEMYASSLAFEDRLRVMMR